MLDCSDRRTSWKLFWFWCSHLPCCLVRGQLMQIIHISPKKKTPHKPLESSASTPTTHPGFHLALALAFDANRGSVAFLCSFTTLFWPASSFMSAPRREDAVSVRLLHPARPSLFESIRLWRRWSPGRDISAARRKPTNTHERAWHPEQAVKAMWGGGG